jgi:hypothetical protein
VTPEPAAPGAADPREDLAAVVAALVEGAGALADTLALERFAPSRAALVRLADPAWRGRAAAACTPAEAERLAAVLRERWMALIGDDLPGLPAPAAER